MLAAASQVLAASFDLTEPLRQVARMMVPLLGDIALLDLARFQGGARARGDRHRRSDQTGRAPARRPRGWTLQQRVLSSGRPIVIAKPTMAAALLGAGGLPAKAALLVPLTSTKGPLGVLTLVSMGGLRRSSAHDLTPAQDLAGRIGTAIERAQLYNQAKEAIAAREDILSFVSHDLKNSSMSLFLNVEMLHPKRTAGRAAQRLEATRANPTRRSPDAADDRGPARRREHRVGAAGH